MNVLEELYFGNIQPCEQSFDRRSEYASFMKIISDNEETLTNYLNTLPKAEEERHLFSQLINAQGEVLRFSELDRFIKGFQLGARFMLDALVLPQNSAVRDIS